MSFCFSLIFIFLTGGADDQCGDTLFDRMMFFFLIVQMLTAMFSFFWIGCMSDHYNVTLGGIYLWMFVLVSYPY